MYGTGEDRRRAPNGSERHVKPDEFVAGDKLCTLDPLPHSLCFLLTADRIDHGDWLRAPSATFSTTTRQFSFSV